METYGILNQDLPDQSALVSPRTDIRNISGELTTFSVSSVHLLHPYNSNKGTVVKVC